MPDIGFLHPKVIRFVVACLYVGLPAYWLGFLKRPRFFRPMATILLVIGTGASIVAVRSGRDAHDLAERIPGVRAEVMKHEDLGIDTRNIFVGILLVELVALAVAWRAGKAGSHQKKGWEEFTDAAVKTLAEKRKNIVYILWGRFAQAKKALINAEDNLILESAHPSPFSAANGFFGCKHFSKTNEYLEQSGKKPIKWI